MAFPNSHEEPAAVHHEPMDELQDADKFMDCDPETLYKLLDVQISNIDAMLTSDSEVSEPKVGPNATASVDLASSFDRMLDADSSSGPLPAGRVEWSYPSEESNFEVVGSDARTSVSDRGSSNYPNPYAMQAPPAIPVAMRLPAEPYQSQSPAMSMFGAHELPQPQLGQAAPLQAQIPQNKEWEYRVATSLVSSQANFYQPANTMLTPALSSREVLNVHPSRISADATTVGSASSSSMSDYQVSTVDFNTPECKECRTTFPDDGALKAHRRKMHPKPKLFACEYPSCKVRFSAKCNLTKHLRSVHLKQRPHACAFPDCTRSFSEKNKLIKHEETVHFGARPFECEYPNCSQVFGQKSDRTRHINVVHLGERRYTCLRCVKAFGRKSSLAQHLIRIHKMQRVDVNSLLTAARGTAAAGEERLSVNPPIRHFQEG